ncbi:MAG: hypothetical protein ABJL67_07535 [Sulfitobacter sp.]
MALTTLGLTACTQFPDLEHTQSTDLKRAAYPALVPIQPILAQNAAPAPDSVEVASTLTTRIDGLRTRAERMRGPILTNAERRRLEQGLQLEN